MEREARKHSHGTLGTDVILFRRERFNINGDLLQHLDHVNLLGEVVQHGRAAAPQIGLQEHGEPLLIVSGLGYLTSQEPKQEMANSFVLRVGTRRVK